MQGLAWGGAIEGTRCVDRLLSIEVDPRAHFLLANFYALDAGADDRFRTRLSLREERGQLPGRKLIERSIHIRNVTGSLFALQTFTGSGKLAHPFHC